MKKTTTTKNFKEVGSMYKSVRNGQLAKLVEDKGDSVILELAETGEVKEVNQNTFKRWWKQTDEQEVPAEETKEEDKVDTNVENAQEEQQTVPTEEKPKKESKKRGRVKIAGDHELAAFILKLAEERGCEVFEGKVVGFRSLKVDGHMFMAFTFNTKGVSLWLRQKAVETLTEFKHMNHMFDARVNFTEMNDETAAKITELMDASLNYQVELKASTLRAQREAKRAEKAAAKKAAETSSEAEAGEEA